MNNELTFQNEEKESIDIEYNLHRMGYNPMFGELTLHFPFEPKCYQDEFKQNKSKQDYLLKIQERFKSLHYYYTNDVKVVITLLFSEHKRYATPDIGDLDNYAKVICDSLKGVNGIMIDDTQIQSLDITWVDTCADHRFEIMIKSLPDYFSLKPLKLFEMPDHLFYPLSQISWTINGPEKLSDDAFNKYVEYLKASIHRSKTWRHELRESGSNPNDAYFMSRDISPDIRGYHKNRILDAGFEIVYLRN